MIGIQVGAVSFVDEGVDKVLDEFQRDAAVNTLFLATFTYGRGIAGRQVPGQPLPDHGKQEYDTGTFYGGNYATIHPQYYKNTVFQGTRAPDLGDYDVLQAVLPEARKRGIKTICWFEDVFRKDLPHIEQLQEKEMSGQNATTLCFNNPNYRNFLLGIVDDWSHSYEIDGVMWGSERQGPFANALGASAGGRNTNPHNVTCFCQFCEAKAKERGINPERARQGFLELAKFVDAGRKGQRPVDGYYVEVWRLMLRYPELLAWEMLWTHSLRETYAAIYKQVKEAKSSLGVGWHIWHTNSFNPIYRAEQDLAAIAPVSDFLKIVIYHNCGGERMAEYIGAFTRHCMGMCRSRSCWTFTTGCSTTRKKAWRRFRLQGYRRTMFTVKQNGRAPVSRVRGPSRGRALTSTFRRRPITASAHRKGPGTQCWRRSTAAPTA